MLGDLACDALPGGQYDLVLASYALTEMAEGLIDGLADALWARTTGLLVIVEPGRPRDYERLLRIRARLLGQGAEMVAPCPHAGACPLVAPDWCHFSVRLARTKAHMQMKGATLPYEDEKFSYLVLARPGVTATPVAARVLAPVEVSKFDARLKLCTPDGLEQGAVMKRDKAAYRQVHKLSWGDGLDIVPGLR
jgi:ribosomal protein RSM22 (predicted rRNA methylase)